MKYRENTRLEVEIALSPPAYGFWNGGRPDVAHRPDDWGEQRWIPLSEIPVVNQIHTRAHRSQIFHLELRNRYLDNGYDDYPVEVVHDVEHDAYYLWDGRYRHEAAEGLCEAILANVLQGTKDDASWLAFTMGNRIKRDRRRRGKIGWMPLSNADKRFQMEQAILHPYAQGMPIYKVQERVGVSIHTAYEGLRALRRSGLVGWRGDRLKHNFVIGHAITTVPFDETTLDKKWRI